MKSQNLICGVDVSKDTLDLFFNDEAGREQHLKVPNDQKGYLLVLQKRGVKRTYVMEASGPYYLRLAFTLKNNGADVRVENPIVVKRYIQMQLERNKSDRKDARWLYRYGVEREAAEWNLPPEEGLKCAQVMGSMDLLTRQSTMIQNQLHSLEQVPIVCKEVVKALQKNFKDYSE